MKEKNIKRKKFIILIVLISFIIILGVVLYFLLINKKSDENTLSSLVVIGESINYTNGKETYNLKVKNSIDNLNINAIPVDDKAKVTITGNKNLMVGPNQILIEVKAKNGDIRTYKINVTKEGANDNIGSDHKLKSLEITNYDIDFDPDKTSYSLTVDNNTTSLNIKAEAVNKEDIVTINGDKELKEGLNTITIKVAPNTGTAMTYTINVTRNTTHNIPQE